MSFPAAVLLIIAIIIFVAVHFGVPRRWATLSLGLAFLALALGVQFVWQAHQWVVR